MRAEKTDAIPMVVYPWSCAARCLTNTAVAAIVEYENHLFPSSLVICIVVVARVFRECSVQPYAPLALSPRVSCRTRHGEASPGKQIYPCPPPAHFRNPLVDPF